MQTIKDKTGRQWKLDINLGIVRRLKSDGHDFHELAEKRFQKFLSLERDDEAFMQWLWWMVKATDHNQNTEVSERDFIDDFFDGQTMWDAWEVFANAYQNFIRDPAIRSALNEGLERSKKTQEKAMEVIKERAKRMEELAEEEIAYQTKTQMSDEKIKSLLRPPVPSEPSSIS